jgi:hypothetical protein
MTVCGKKSSLFSDFVFIERNPVVIELMGSVELVASNVFFPNM